MVYMAKMINKTETVRRLPKGQSHPYLAWEGTPLWRAVDRSVADLVANQDLIEKELREYIVGYICKTIDRRKKAVIAQLRSHSHSDLSKNRHVAH
jgi:hypothetical protein